MGFRGEALPSMDAITEKRDGAISQSAAVSGPKELKAPPLRPAAIASAAIEIRRFSVIAYTRPSRAPRGTRGAPAGVRIAARTSLPALARVRRPAPSSRRRRRTHADRVGRSRATGAATPPWLGLFSSVPSWQSSSSAAPCLRNPENSLGATWTATSIFNRSRDYANGGSVQETALCFACPPLPDRQRRFRERSRPPEARSRRRPARARPGGQGTRRRHRPRTRPTCPQCGRALSSNPLLRGAA